MAKKRKAKRMVKKRIKRALKKSRVPKAKKAKRKALRKVVRKAVKRVRKSMSRAAPKAAAKKVAAPALQEVGMITHFYPQINVGVVEVKKPLRQGDQIMISGHGRSFYQKVASMQIEHESVSVAKRNQIIGMKVAQPVKENDVVYKVE